MLVYGLTGLAVRSAEQRTLSGVDCLVLDDRGSNRSAKKLRGQLAELGVPTVPVGGSDVQGTGSRPAGSCSGP